MEKFWQSGYEGTSVTDLIGHLGLNGTTLYRLFHSKHQLYLSALASYRARYLDTLLAGLEDVSPEVCVRTLLERWGDLVADERRWGCLMVNAAVECMPHDDLVEIEVVRFWTRIEATLVRSFERGQECGDLGPEKSPVALARFVLALMQGLGVTAKMRRDPAGVEGIIRTVVDALR